MNDSRLNRVHTIEEEGDNNTKSYAYRGGEGDTMKEEKTIV